ncbi:MAG: lysophospholipid acyltransferase family protein [Verrucomicrobium sp.]|nr:lysophospholipid acyltransferase family protein [Verrucomicrobium sp.]
MKGLYKSRFVAWLAARLIKALFATLRFEVSGLENIRHAGPRLFVFWHDRLLLAPSIYRWIEPRRPGMALISRSRDGETIARIISHFRIEAGRGSTSKKGGMGLRALVRVIEQRQADVAITPDGPRGPRHEVKPGILQLAQWTGHPIIPIVYSTTPHWKLPSWDRFQIPKPFAKCRLAFGAPIRVPAEAGAEEVERLRKELAKILGE